MINENPQNCTVNAINPTWPMLYIPLYFGPEVNKSNVANLQFRQSKRILMNHCIHQMLVLQQQQHLMI